MDTEPLISVIVPVYNVEPYIDKCIESILSQSYQNLDIILVDDGSFDGSSDKCDQWEEKDNRVKVIHKPNGGLSDARNTGLKIAQGDYISFVDSDDWLNPHFYEFLYHAIVSTGSEIACCNYVRIYDCEQETIAAVNDEATCICVEQALKMLICREGIEVYAWNKLFKHSAVQGLYFEKGKLHEDILFTYQAVSRVETVAYNEALLYNYRCTRENSILNSKYTLKRLDAIDMRLKRLRLIEKDHPELAFMAKRELITRCCSNLYKSMLFLPFIGKLKASAYLSYVLSRLKISFHDWLELKPSHKTWVTLSKLFFIFLSPFSNY